MAKNMIRKTLAIGSGLALVLTGLVAAPASAAAGVNLTAKNAKTVFGMLEGEEFTFEAAGNADFNSSQQDKLRVEVKNVTGGSAASGFKINGVALDATNDITLLGGGSTAISLDTDAGDSSVFGAGTAAGVSTMTTPFTFTFLSTATSSVAQVYDVTTFVDVNNDGVRQADELASPTRTVTWYESSKVEVSIAIDSAFVGATAVGAEVTSSQIALDQLIVADTGVHFTHADGASITSTAVVDAIAQKSTDKAILEADLTIDDALDAGDGIKAQLQFKSTGTIDTSTPGNNTNVGAAASILVTAATVGSIAGSVVDNGNGVTTNATGQVRNDGTFQVKAVVKTPAPVVVLPGKAVQATIASSRALSSTVKLTIGGVTYTDSSKLPGASGVAKFAAGTTDANGEVSFDITNEGFTDADTITVTFAIETLTSAMVATLKDEVYTGFITNLNGDTVATTDGGPVSLNVVVLDQFGGNAPDGFKVNAVFDTGSGYVAQATTASTSASGSSATIAAGKATLTITDNGTGAGTNMYDIGFNNGTPGASDTSIQADLKIKIGKSENTVPGSFTVTDGSTALALNTDKTFLLMTAGQRGASDTLLPLQTVASGNNTVDSANKVTFKNHDSRSERGASVPNVIADSAANHAVLAGTVTSSFSSTAASAALPNAPITVSGEGLLFEIDAPANIFGNGSLTFNADASGDYSVKVYSQKVGKNYVTITSGGVSKTVELNTAVAEGRTGTTWTAENITVEPQKSFYVKATLSDRFGNPVKSDVATASAISIKWNGPVFTSPNTLPTVTDKDGLIQFGVLPAANDDGTYTATITYGGHDGVIGTGSDDVTVTITVTIGDAPAGAYGTVSAWTKNMGDGTAKVYVKYPTLGDKLRIGHQTGGSGSYETIFVKTIAAESDSALTVNSNGYYIVRTIDLEDINRIRVTVGDDTLVQVRYNE